MPPAFQPTLKIMEALTPLDWTVFILVQAATLGAVVYGHRRRGQPAKGREGVLDLLLMGRRLTLPMFVATLVATWYGGIFGVTEIAFNHGIFNFITQGVFWYAAYLIFAIFLVPKIRSYDAVTLPDLVARMFGPRAGRLSAIFNFFNILPVAYTISIGLFLQVLFGGPLLANMLLGMVPIALYTMWGGFRAVVYSDLVQFVVMCVAVALVAGLSVLTFGGLPFLRAHLPATHFAPTGGHTWSATLVWGFVALATLVDPSFYQRCFAARTPGVARRGIFVATGIWILFDLCTTAGGMYARAVIPEAASGQAYLTYALQLLPPGLRGLMLAGVAATILSTLDAFLFIAGNTVAYDLAPRRWREGVGRQRLGIAVAAVISILMALIFDGSIREAWKTLGSYAAACLLLPVLIGYLWPGRIGDRQFVCGALVGVAATTLWRVLLYGFTLRLPWVGGAGYDLIALAPRLTGFWAEVDALYIGATATALGLIFYPSKQNRRS